MNFFTKIHDILRQKDKIVKKPQKHDANLQKNSTLYFQVGLIICLLATNALFEMYFETSVPETIVYDQGLDEETYTATPRIEPKPIAMVKPEPKPVVKQRRLIKEPIIVDNNTYLKPEKPNVVVLTTPVKPTTVIPKKKIVDNAIYNPNNVERMPIFPGCEMLVTNAERKQCMSDKLSKFIQRKFDGDKAVELGLTGKQRIDVAFTVDKSGQVTNIRARAPHPGLEAEAKRVIGKVPQMQPGKQKNIPVNVVYTLPIVFQVQN